MPGLLLMDDFSFDPALFDAFLMLALWGFNANSPSSTRISELLALWDVAIAVGVHMHILFAVARMLLMRDKLLASPNPNSQLLSVNKWPDFEASAVINVAFTTSLALPSELYSLIAAHPFVPRD